MFICCRPISPLQEWHYSKLFNLQTNQVLQVGFVVTVTQEASLRESARLQQKAENLAVGSALIVAHADCWVKTENIIYVSGKHRRSVQLMQLSVGSPGAFLACIKWEKKRGKLCESLENHPLSSPPYQISLLCGELISGREPGLWNPVGTSLWFLDISGMWLETPWFIQVCPSKVSQHLEYFSYWITLTQKRASSYKAQTLETEQIIILLLDDSANTHWSKIEVSTDIGGWAVGKGKFHLRVIHTPKAPAYYCNSLGPGLLSRLT